MREAAARAASRLGSSITIRPQPASISAIGTRVVLPAPGGATSIALPRNRSSAGSVSSTGKSTRTPHEQKFFASFFQKRRPFFLFFFEKKNQKTFTYCTRAG
jgi:hypothetical protein